MLKYIQFDIKSYMQRIVSTSDAQKKIGQISKTIGDDFYIVTSHGKGKMVILPYFDGCEEHIEDYMEDYEMMSNRDVLVARYKESIDSGESSLVI